MVDSKTLSLAAFVVLKFRDLGVLEGTCVYGFSLPVETEVPFSRWGTMGVGREFIAIPGRQPQNPKELFPFSFFCRVSSLLALALLCRETWSAQERAYSQEEEH